MVHGQSLTRALGEVSDSVGVAETALYKELAYGTLRWFHELNSIVSQLLDKPLKNKDQDIGLLLLMGIYQLKHLSVSEHAVLSETVEVAREIKKDWATGLVNAILRNYQRNRKKIETQLAGNEVAAYSHPRWLIKLIKSSWPDDWQAVLQANNQRPPMFIRVNSQKISRQGYLAELEKNNISAEIATHATFGLHVTQPVPVDRLPGFFQGHASVQDAAAQLAAELLQIENGQRVLDACAAPGGKTCHVLQLCPGLEKLVAVDVDEARLNQVRDNLARLGLDSTDGVVELVQADMSDTQAAGWQGEKFDRILLDAPCSATGVIRRHPDIKLLRKPGDISGLVELQSGVLQSAWRQLKPGGRLVYATCSILPQENTLQMEQFLAQHADAKEKIIDAAWGRPCRIGRQILPGEGNMDGFYYACIEKLT